MMSSGRSTDMGLVIVCHSAKGSMSPRPCTCTRTPVTLQTSIRLPAATFNTFGNLARLRFVNGDLYGGQPRAERKWLCVVYLAAPEKKLEPVTELLDAFGQLPQVVGVLLCFHDALYGYVCRPPTKMFGLSLNL